MRTQPNILESIDNTINHYKGRKTDNVVNSAYFPGNTITIPTPEADRLIKQYQKRLPLTNLLKHIFQVSQLVS